jgi:hypothetical protein
LLSELEKKQTRDLHHGTKMAYKLDELPLKKYSAEKKSHKFPLIKLPFTACERKSQQQRLDI